LRLRPAGYHPKPATDLPKGCFGFKFLKLLN